MSSSSANANSGGASPSSMPRLGPAWHRGAGNQGGRGFQPPPAVPSERRGRSMSSGSAGSGDGRTSSQSNVNKFSILDDDDEDINVTNNNGGNGSTEPRSSNSRFEALKSSAPTGPSKRVSAGGRSLADLAARSSGPPQGTVSSTGPTSSRFSGLRTSDPAEGSTEKIIQYTREKLLSMRPQPTPEIPEVLKFLEGNSILSTVPQDPVCWDTFDADEIWAQAARERPPRGSMVKGAGPPGMSETRRSSERGPTNFGGGRWQRGVALPPEGEQSTRRVSRAEDGHNPNDLWDDPLATGAAADFSAFGDIPDDDEPKKDTPFDFSEMAEASRKFDEELHGKSVSSGDEGGEDEQGDSHMHRVDPKRPLADANTTIRSGSGDDVNVFEDFDSVGEEEPDQTAAPATTEAEERDNHIKAADEDPNASSRLMKMIGVNSEATSGEAAAAVAAAAAQTEGTPATTISSWGNAETAAEAQSPNSVKPIGEINAPSLSIPKNPWGDPIVPVGGGAVGQQQEGLNLAARLEAAVAEQKAREAKAAEEEQQRRQMQEAEMLQRRRQEEEEAQRRAQQEAQARQAAIQQQQQPQQGGGHSQVELVLMERISTILENSWGKSDLMSILSTLHSEDSRVIPLLSNADALRALIARHPRRVGLQHDPSFGAEMAVLHLTNTQWQQQQQQQQQEQQQLQQQAQIRAQQEEMQRQQQQQQRLQAMQEAAAARARAEAEERAAAPSIIQDAPWFYADPQNNIQGPFKGEEMQQWLQAGYFKGNLPISQQPSGPFRPLSQIFPDLGFAFQAPGPSPGDDAKNEEAERENRAKEEAARIEAEKAEAEANAEKARMEAEEKARAAAEAEAAAEREAKEKETAKAATKEANPVAMSGQNDSSAHLKMLLGLGSATQAQENVDPADTANVSKKAKEKSNSKRMTESSSSQQPQEKQKQPQQEDGPQQQKQEQKQKQAEKRASKSAKAKASKQQQPTVPSAPSNSQPNASARSSPPAAWGAKTSAAAPRKSMEQIQQEEARAAAILAMNKQSLPRSGSGWANVAAKGGGSAAWSGGAVKPTPAGGVVTTPVATTTTTTTTSARVAPVPQQQARAAVPQKQPQQQRSSVNTTGITPKGPSNEFGADGKMSKELETWCKEQMRRLNGSEDLTLVSFCMTLTDGDEIRQYLTAYLGTTAQVNNFATEFINRKSGKAKQDEWINEGTTKKGRRAGKKVGGK